MKWFNRKQKIDNNPAQEKSAGFGSVGQSVFNNYLSCGHLSAWEAYLLYTISDAVGDAVDRIAWAFEAIDPVLVNKNTGKVLVKDTDHPALELLADPGIKTKKEQLFFELMVSFLLTGEFYPLLVGNVKFDPVEIDFITPDNVTPVQGGDGRISSILTSAVDNHNQYNKELDLKRRVVTYQTPDKLQELHQGLIKKGRITTRGQSPLTRLTTQVYMKYYGNVHNSSVLKNASRPGGMFMPGGDSMSPDQYKAFKKEVDNHFTGPSVAGRNIVSPVPVKYENFLLNTRDMDFLKLIESSTTTIYNMYQIPLPLIMSETMTMNNFQNSILALFDLAVLPRGKFLFKNFGDFLLSRYKDGKDYKLTIDESQIPALKQRLYERAKTMREIFVHSDNEIRTSTGDESIGDEGHLIYKPSMWGVSGDDDYDDDNITKE